MSEETHVTGDKVWMSKKDFINEHNRLLKTLKSGSEYEDQKEELKEVKTMMDNPMEEKKDVMDAKSICKAIKRLMKKEAKEGDNADDVEKLQKAYDLCKEVAGEEMSDMSEKGDEEPKERPMRKINAATMPMSDLRNKINPPNLNSY